MLCAMPGSDDVIHDGTRVIDGGLTIVTPAPLADEEDDVDVI